MREFKLDALLKVTQAINAQSSEEFLMSSDNILVIVACSFHQVFVSLGREAPILALGEARDLVVHSFRCPAKRNHGGVDPVAVSGSLIRACVNVYRPQRLEDARL